MASDPQGAPPPTSTFDNLELVRVAGAVVLARSPGGHLYVVDLEGEAYVSPGIAQAWADAAADGVVGLSEPLDGAEAERAVRRYMLHQLNPLEIRLAHAALLPGFGCAACGQETADQVSMDLKDARPSPRSHLDAERGRA